MHDATAHPLARGTFRTTLTGIGRPGPIEERLGHRLIRIVQPESKEGIDLLRSGRVTFVGPEGDALGCADLTAARKILRRRLQDRLRGTAGSERLELVRDGLARLRRAGHRTERV